MTSNTMIVNQIQFLHKLREAGFSDKQAETLTEAIASDIVSGLATKEDLKKEIDSVRKDVQIIEHRLYWKIMAGMAVLLTVMPAFTKYLASFLGQ